MKKIILLTVVLVFMCGLAFADSLSTDEINRKYMGWVKIGDNYGNTAIDKATGSVQTIDYAHHEVHAGSHFFYKDIATLASAASTSYLIVTPNTTKWAHLTFSATGSAITQADLYEGPSDLSGTGTRQVIFNNDRNSTATSGLQIWDDCDDGATAGTLLYSIKSGAATQQSSTPGVSERGNEIILKQNTKYLLRVTSGTNDNLTNLLLEWYEHTNKA